MTEKNTVEMMEASECVYGHFTAKVEGSPIVAFVERREAKDQDWIDEGITTYYIVKSDMFQYDKFLFSEEEFRDFLAKSSWSWDFHKKEE